MKGNDMNTSVKTALMGAARQPKPANGFARIGAFFALNKQRRDLAALDQHVLNDIGVNHHQAQAESQKMPWDVPYHWHH